MCICVCRLVFNMNDIIERTGWKVIIFQFELVWSQIPRRWSRGAATDRCVCIRERNVHAYVRGDTRAITARLAETWRWVWKKNVRTGPISRSRSWFDEQRRYILGMRWPRTFKLLFIRKDKDHSGAKKRHTKNTYRHTYIHIERARANRVRCLLYFL